MPAAARHDLVRARARARARVRVRVRFRVRVRLRSGLGLGVTTVSSSRRVGSLAGLLPHTGLVRPLASARDAGADAGRLRAAWG